MVKTSPRHFQAFDPSIHEAWGNQPLTTPRKKAVALTSWLWSYFFGEQIWWKLKGPMIFARKLWSNFRWWRRFLQCRGSPEYLANSHPVPGGRSNRWATLLVEEIRGFKGGFIAPHMVDWLAVKHGGLQAETKVSLDYNTCSWVTL